MSTYYIGTMPLKHTRPSGRMSALLRSKSSKKVSKPVKTYVQRSISRRTETKIQTGYHSNEITSTLGAISLITISQGVTEDDRVGNVVTPTYFHFKGRIVPKSAASAQLVRLVLLQWKPNRNDFAITADDVLYDTTNQPLFSPLQFNNPQYKLLADRLYQVPDVTETNRNGVPVYFRIPRRKMMKIRWKNDNATEDSGHLYLVTIGETATGTGAVTLNAHHMLKFKDA